MMKRCFMKRLRSENGFTLVEVMVVLMILGFLASLAFPQFSKVIANSQERADQANIKIIESALEVYCIEEGDYPSGITSFDGLVTELNNKGYIRQTEIKAADPKKFKFTYDSSDHKVKRDPISATPVDPSQ